jgi:hypothetical protein
MLEYIRTNDNPADFLTKILPAPRFRVLRNGIMHTTKDQFDANDAQEQPSEDQQSEG